MTRGIYNVFSMRRAYLGSIIFLAILSAVTAQDSVIFPPIGDRSKERMVQVGKRFIWLHFFHKKLPSLRL